MSLSRIGVGPGAPMCGRDDDNPAEAVRIVRILRVFGGQQLGRPGLVVLDGGVAVDSNPPDPSAVWASAATAPRCLTHASSAGDRTAWAWFSPGALPR